MANLDVQDAIRKARSFVVDLFKEETITDIGLEEVEHEFNTWKITIGFNRNWKSPTITMLTMVTQPSAHRYYKVVTIADADGTLVSIKNRRTDS